MVKFGTGGWRAIIGDTFIKDNIILVAQALSELMLEENVDPMGIVIGYDRRFISDKAARWLSEVFAGNGIKVYFIDKVSPTPLIMFSVQGYKTHYGMAITASHNPADYNGIKIFTQGGKDANEDVTGRIEDRIEKLTPTSIKSIPFNQGIEAGIIEVISPFNAYVDTIIHMLDVESIKKKNMRILLDPMFGVSKTCLQAILVTARCEVDTINDRHDTMFGGRLPSPTALTLSRLSDMVVESGYDLGIGTDGDADRLGVIDEKGCFIHPNKIMALLYYYLLKYKGWKGPVVRNLATTHLLDAIANQFGEICYEVPVGFKHISAKMAETDAIIGGESSGGLTIKGHVKGKDGIFAAGLLVEMMSVTNKRLREMLGTLDEEFGLFEMVEANLEYDVLEKPRLLKLIYEDKKIPDFGRKIEKISYEDGLKIYLEEGWIIVRFSGTEPLIRIFAEMTTEFQANQLVGIMKAFMGL